MANQGKLPPKILGIMAGTTLATFGILVATYRLLF